MTLSNEISLFIIIQWWASLLLWTEKQNSRKGNAVHYDNFQVRTHPGFYLLALGPLGCWFTCISAATVWPFGISLIPEKTLAPPQSERVVPVSDHTWSGATLIVRGINSAQIVSTIWKKNIVQENIKVNFKRIKDKC